MKNPIFACLAAFAVSTTSLAEWKITQVEADELRGVKPYTMYSYTTNKLSVVFYSNSDDVKLITHESSIFDWATMSEHIKGKRACEVTVGLYRDNKLVDKANLLMYDQTPTIGTILAWRNAERENALIKLDQLLPEHHETKPIGASKSARGKKGKTQSTTARTPSKTALDMGRIYNCVRMTNCHARIVAPYFDSTKRFDITIPYCNLLPAKDRKSSAKSASRK